MDKPVIRCAELKDAEAILRIYTPYIINTAITFEYDIPSLKEFQQRIAGITTDYPYLVCQSGQRILGYAYAHKLKERAAYGWNAELSVYVDQSCLHLGIGNAMYHALIPILKLQNVHNVYAGITVPNISSEKFHEAFGFKHLGTYHKTGYKCGAWHDVAWYEKNILDYEDRPEPFLPIYMVDKEKIEKILKQSSEMLRDI